jgi:nucleotide-binding universal stress UspA family protein
MFRTLIVPLDGSEQAERSLPYAVRLAESGGGRLVLVRTALGPPPSGQDWESQQTAAIDEANAYLVDVARKLATRVPVASAVPYGHAAEQILQSVQQYDADAIVMTTHGRTGLAHLMHGSVAEAVVAQSHVPVLVLYTRPGEAPAAPFDVANARILVPLDGSALSETAVPVAASMLGIAGELVLLTVVELPEYVKRDDSGRVIAYIDQQESVIRQEGLEYLHNIARSMTATNPDLHVASDVRLGSPAEGILTAEIDRAADVVVMATHGLTGVRRSFTGSVAGQVVREGYTPVLLVPPHAFAGAAVTTTAAEPSSAFVSPAVPERS